ncbi:MAG: GNAT family N-acetyltransferase [Pseudomonadales bacterium]|nr:GNAT family N-acetyltransferase [Pseudomonadales bacterium]
MDWTLYPIDKFDAHREQWDRLNQTSFNAPTLNSAFISPSLKYFSTGKEKLALYGDPANPSAAAIIQKNKFGSWSTFQPSQNPLGAWLQDQTLDFTTITEKLIQRIPGICLVFGVTQQDPSLQERPQPNKTINTIDYIQTARIALDGNFDDYWSKRGKNLRQNLRRQGNRLERENTQVTLKCLIKVEEVISAVEAYGTLESAGWKNDSGTAIGIHNDQGRFYTDMLENFCAKDQGRIYQYWYNERLVATDLCITGGDAIIILKTTYDETIKTSSPAMLMRKDSFESLFSEPDLKLIEFYGEVMDWHTKWSADIRTMHHANIYRHKLLRLI